MREEHAPLNLLHMPLSVLGDLGVWSLDVAGTYHRAASSAHYRVETS